MQYQTKRQAMSLIRQAWDCLESSVDKSADELAVIAELQGSYDHLSTLPWEGEVTTQDIKNREQWAVD